MSKNDVSTAYRIENPGRRKRSKILKTLLRAIDSRELPDDFPAVTWMWRNTPSQDMRSDDFLTAVEESRSGFHTIMRRRLEKDIAHWEAIEAAGESPAQRRRDRQADLFELDPATGELRQAEAPAPKKRKRSATSRTMDRIRRRARRRAKR